MNRRKYQPAGEFLLFDFYNIKELANAWILNLQIKHKIFHTEEGKTVGTIFKKCVDNQINF
jgi:hypothetical protein